MPTSSTSKLFARRQQGLTTASPSRPSPSRRLYRSGSKYDTYRRRYPHSRVDEHLFGEPLKNKIIRSKSMSNLSQESQKTRTNPENEVVVFRKNANYIENRNLVKNIRPKTAMATLGASKSSKLMIVSRDSVRTVRVPNKSNEEQVQPLVLTRELFQSIIEASQPAEPVSSLETGLAEAEERERRARLLAAPKSRAPKSTPRRTSLKKTREEEAIMSRHDFIKEEQMAEIRRLNAWILGAQCAAQQEIQKQEKQKRLAELAEADRHLEEEMETARTEALLMEERRQQSMLAFREEYKQRLKEQLREQEEDKVLQEEKKSLEEALRKQVEQEMREEERKEREQQRERGKRIKEAMQENLESVRIRRQQEIEAAKERDQEILALQQERSQLESQKEQQKALERRVRDDNQARLRRFLEDEADARRSAEERRMIVDEDELRSRQIDRDRHEKETRLELLKNIDKERSRQISERRAKKERSKQEEREWREALQQQMAKEDDEQEQNALQSAQRKKQYLAELQQQATARALRSEQERQSFREEMEQEQKEREERRQTQFKKAKERKMQQLRAYNLPERFLRQVELKCDKVDE